MTQLEEYVLTYRDESDKIVCNLTDYYVKQVMPLHSKFTNYYLSPAQLAICPLHDDHDPSLGLIHDRHLKGVYIYHCFGCNKTGNIIRFHQYIESHYHKRELSIKECCYDLCRIFSIPEPDLLELADDDYEAKYRAKLKRIDGFSSHYTFKDYHDEILGIRKKAKGGMVDLKALNNANIKYIATEKGLYT